jgi:hypothetical protein
MNPHKTAPASAITIDLTFPHHWQAQIIPARPAILPARHFVYPRDVEEIERGALEVLVCADLSVGTGSKEGTGFSPHVSNPQKRGALAPEAVPGAAIPTPAAPALSFLATCAVGFLDPIVPTGVWSAPNPNEICAVSGGYAYLIDTSAPERFTMIPFRPVLEVRPLPAQGLLLFVGHYAIIAWGRNGQAWQSDKLSDEGVTITGIEDGVLHGVGWSMMTDRETPFAIDLKEGSHLS